MAIEVALLNAGDVDPQRGLQKELARDGVVGLFEVRKWPEKESYMK